jgi:ribosome-binding ATPase YchF (GTP1/OBG family)
VIYAANVPDSDLATGNAMSNKVKEYSERTKSKFVIVSAQVRKDRGRETERKERERERERKN